MKLGITFVHLEAAQKKMGARFAPWVSPMADKETPEFLIQLNTGGIEIVPSDIEASGNGLIVYKGQYVLLHIKDTQQDHQTLLHEPDKARRFHIADQCDTLGSMRLKNRYDRYVVSTRRDGLFRVDALSYETGLTEEIEAPLKVCKNCLKALNYKSYAQVGYQEKTGIWEQFSIPKFFEHFTTNFSNVPKFTDLTCPPNTYAKGWALLSNRLRKQANWTCQSCRVNLSNCKGLIHTHHKNGLKSDNSRANLVVLCALCHSQQAGHHHMGVSAAARGKIISTRVEQGFSVK